MYQNFCENDNFKTVGRSGTVCLNNKKQDSESGSSSSEYR